MAPNLRSRIKNLWNVFNAEPEQDLPFNPFSYGMSSGSRPDRHRMSVTNERSIVASIYNRIGIDSAAWDIKHVKLDDNDRYLETVDSGLNRCFDLEANVDQAATHFKQDIFMTLLDKGTIGIVPIDTSDDPNLTTGYEIRTMRVGEVVEWKPQHVRLRVYNDDPKSGQREEILLSKTQVAIVENPLYQVMNEPNSTLQRLNRKLNLLDAVDEQTSSGKLDIIIQLPYVIRTEKKREEAEKRRKDIEEQLKGSQYGIAYTDGTERITQLNRPSENNLLKQVEYLTGMLYGQLGVTESVFNGTASEREMVNYQNRTIEPMVNAVVEAMRRTFLTQTARTQKHSIVAFRDPFKYVGLSEMAELADKLTRNEILTSNEVRGILGMKPVQTARADELINKNMPEQLDPEAEFI